MKEKKSWEMPETARVYEESMKAAKLKDMKHPISQDHIDEFDDLYEELQEKINQAKDMQKKKAIHRKLNLLKFLMDHFTNG